MELKKKDLNPHELESRMSFPNLECILRFLVTLKPNYIQPFVYN